MHIPVLEVKNVHKRFGRLYILKGIDFKVNRGEAVGITGENGSGKSTLLKIIVGLLPCDQGEVCLRGTFGYCSQDPLLFDDLAMEGNIEYFSTAYGLDIQTLKFIVKTDTASSVMRLILDHCLIGFIFEPNYFHLLFVLVFAS